MCTRNALALFTKLNFLARVSFMLVNVFTGQGKSLKKIPNVHFSVAKKLLELKPEMAAIPDRTGTMPLHFAALYDDMEVAELLLETVRFCK